MASDRPHYQVVFLIDLLQSKSCGSQTEDVRPSTICLTVFRVLVNLLGKIRERSEKDERQVNKACQKLKWGCKFFNSLEHKGKIERSQFKSFKLKHFEVFEKEVEKRIGQCRRAADTETTDSNVENKKRRCSLGYKAKANSPGDNVGKVLSEVFADFQWERPDLMSPGRPHRRKGKPARWGRAGLNSSRDESANGARYVRNLLFILSNCPNNEERLKSFCGKKCIDGDVFLDSVLTTAMIDKLRGNLRLDLFWIDTGGRSVENDVSVNENSVGKVRDALGKVGGKLIPLDAILQGHTGQTLSCYDNKFPSILLPSLSHQSGTTGQNSENLYTCSGLKSGHVDYSCIVPTTCSLEHYLHEPEVCDKRRSLQRAQAFGEHASAGHLCIQAGEKEVTVCKLLLQSAIKHPESPNLGKEREITCSRGGSLRSSLPAQAGEVATSSTGIQDVSSAVVNTYGMSADEAMGAYRFRVVGAVGLKPHLVRALSTGTSFICCGQPLNAEKVQSSLRSRYFQSLISEMITQQKVLVISLQVIDMKKKGLGHGLAMLRPMTLQSGILTILSSDQALVLEKHQLSVSQDDQGETTAVEGFDEWRNKVIQCQLKVPAKTETNSHNSEKSQPSEPRPFNSGMLETWYSSGPSVRMASLVQKLSDRVESFGFLSVEEKALLKQVQKQYRRENQPMLSSQYEQRDLKAKLEQEKTEQDKADGEDVDEVDGSVGSIVFLQRLRSNTSIVTGGRSELMLKSGIQKSKKKSALLAEEVEKSSKKQRIRPGVNAADFQDVNELVSYLQNVYSKTIAEEDSVDTCVQTIVLVALHFLKQSGADNPEESLKNLLDEKILISNKTLRQKHSQAHCYLSEDQKLLEYKLQIQLQFEIAASQTDVDTMTEDCIEEVCNMLRKWSISGKLDIKQYLEDVLVEHYIHTLPKSLGSLYSTLMLPLPDQLAKVVPRGDHFSLDDSCLSDTLMSPASSVGQGSVAAPSNPPSLNQQPLSDRSDILMSANFKANNGKYYGVCERNTPRGTTPWNYLQVAARPFQIQLERNSQRPGRDPFVIVRRLHAKLPTRGLFRSRKMAVHPSLSDIGPKRQIMVAVNPASRKRTKSKQTKGPRSAKKGSTRKGSARKCSARKGSARKSSARKKKKESADADVRAVRRNLFMSEGKLERRQSVAVMENLRSPKGRRRQRSALCSPRRSPRAKTNTPNLVAETPAHKQKLVLRRKESQREMRLESAPVVMESPLKPGPSPNSSATSERRSCFSNRSPAKPQIKVLSARRSFYSAGPRSQSRNLERYRQLANRIAGRDPQSQDQLKSPDRLFVVKQLKGSPSPSYSLRCTPQRPNITPVKSVMDSPSQNTRSRAAAKLVLYRDSPKASERTPKENVTRKLTLSMTPEKKTKPQETLFPSFQEGSSWIPGTPTHKISAQDTTSVIDSPSRNTRSQIKSSAGVRNLCFDSNPCAAEKISAVHESRTTIQSTPGKKDPVPLCKETPEKQNLLSPFKKTPQKPNVLSPFKRTPQKQNLLSPVKKTPQKVSWGITSPNERTPQKSSTPCTPKRITTPSNQNTPPTPASILKKRHHPQESLMSPQRPALKVRWREENLECVQDETVDDNSSLNRSSPAENGGKKSPDLPKTPTQSPRKPRVRTPDFDLWPRRKPRFGQVISPKLTASVNTSAPAPPGGDNSDGASTNMHEELVSVGERQQVWRQKPDHSESQDRNQSSKRGIVQIRRSPESHFTGLESQLSLEIVPDKKQKYSTCKSDNQTGAVAKDTAQGESTGISAPRPAGIGKRPRSQDEMDQEMSSVKRHCRAASLAAPMPLSLSNPPSFKPDPASFSSITDASARSDYFAPTNEEVFLSGGELSDPVVSPSSDVSSTPSSASSPIQVSPKFTRLHSLKKFARMMSSGSESGMEIAETNSPIFVPVVKQTSNHENCNHETVSESSCNNSSADSPKDRCASVKARVSPACAKSYSPNVSAKGLLSLMNSPLIRSGPGKRSRPLVESHEDVDVVRFTASLQQSNKRRKTVARSRRSLNLLK